jgi:transcriptional regulator with XRE-family HTH domain
MIDKFIRGVRLARTIKGLTAKECAQKANIAPAMWARMEQGTQGYNPTLNTLTAIATALDMSIENLIMLPEKVDDLIAQLTHPNTIQDTVTKEE